MARAQRFPSASSVLCPPGFPSSWISRPWQPEIFEPRPVGGIGTSSRQKKTLTTGLLP